MNVLKVVLLLSAAALVSSCSSDGEERPEYLDSYSVNKLEIPPELTRPNNNEELRIPEPSAKALSMLESRDGVEGRISPKFKGIELQSDGEMYWLLMQKDADDVWLVVRDFLANEGINVYRDEPLLGFIETEWVKEYDASRDAGFLKKMFNAISSDRLDKFRLRLERVEGKQQTRLYVSHRSLEVLVVDEGSSWQQAVPNRMLEKEMLYRMTLFVGLMESAADNMFAEYTPYQARIRPIGDQESAEYEITGSKDIVWRRIIQSLDRMGVDIKEKDQTKGHLEVLVGEITDELLEEKDELSESSWLMNLFSGDSDVTKDKEDRVSVFIALNESNNSTRMLLSLGENQPIVNGLADKFRGGLVGLLK